jgi:hypothetical protein
MPKRKQIGHKALVERPNSFIKKSIIALLGIGILMYPLICFSSYIIHLKDGRQVATDQYWEEAGQIKFRQYGGVIGIQKDLINEIEDVGDLPEKKKKVVVRKAGTDKETVAESSIKAKSVEPAKEQEKQKEASEEEKKKAEQVKAAKREAFIEEKRQIMGQMEIVAAGLKDAHGKNNKAEKRKWLMERTKLLNALSELENSVKSAHDGKLPDWWQNDL